MAHLFYLGSFLLLALVGVAAWFYPQVLWSLLLLLPLIGLGLRDALQPRHAILRNFPLLGRLRYFFERIRPEIRQYFMESDTDGRPYDREHRSVAYQRAKKVLETVPFGTKRNLYEPGYEWIHHSIAATHPPHDPPRVRIGEGRCAKSYDAALLNVSAMSFGSLSAAATRALSGGARQGGFFHNTGEGGVAPHHLEPGGDLCWQIGTGYFGCRERDGRFSRQAFSDTAAPDNVRMIEVKLSQGAKPGHGGILPAKKITPEIAAIRLVEMGSDVLSPPAHTAFDSPTGLLEFIADLREASGGKPIGFKLCVGNPSDFLGICMAMHETGLRPDFITVDGGEGGTGAAPLEFTNRVGSPLTEGLAFVHSALTGFGLRDEIKLIASGKILSGFNMAARIAAGADLCNSARGFMFALGCIQALKCNSNECPVGVATQDPKLTRGLVVGDKATRVANYQQETVEAFLELLGAAGLDHPDKLGPHHIHRRISRTEVQTYAEIFDYLEPGSLLDGTPPPAFAPWMARASAERFVV